MKPETAGKVKYGVWGLIVGAVITMIIGFAWGGWTTSGTGIATLVILGRIIDGEKLCWQGPYNEHMESWGHMMNYG
jgi:hypothetical protein